MTTANHRVNAHPLADLPVRHPIANGVDNAVEFMANNAGIFSKRIMPAVDMAIGTANPRQLNLYPHFSRCRFRPRAFFDDQVIRLTNHNTLHISLLTSSTSLHFQSGHRQTGWFIRDFATRFSSNTMPGTAFSRRHIAVAAGPSVW